MNRESNVMNKNSVRAIAAAIVLTVFAGTTQMVMAQMGSGGGSGHGTMNWGNTSQYGVFEILAVLIGVAVLTLLVVLVVRVSSKSRTP